MHASGNSAQIKLVTHLEGLVLTRALVCSQRDGVKSTSRTPTRFGEVRGSAAITRAAFILFIVTAGS